MYDTAGAGGAEPGWPDSDQGMYRPGAGSTLQVSGCRPKQRTLVKHYALGGPTRVAVDIHTSARAAVRQLRACRARSQSDQLRSHRQQAPAIGEFDRHACSPGISAADLPPGVAPCCAPSCHLRMTPVSRYLAV
jgi:hypothetical protein